MSVYNCDWCGYYYYYLTDRTTGFLHCLLVSVCRHPVSDQTFSSKILFSATIYDTPNKTDQQFRHQADFRRIHKFSVGKQRRRTTPAAVSVPRLDWCPQPAPASASARRCSQFRHRLPPQWREQVWRHFSRCLQRHSGRRIHSKRFFFWTAWVIISRVGNCWLS